MSGCLAKALPFLAWLLSGCALIVWILGTPGVSGTPFANGWAIGFVASLGYLCGYPILLLSAALLRRRPASALTAARMIWYAMAGWVVAMMVSLAVMAG